MNPCFAIIDRSSLSSMALRSILWDIFDNVEVFTYNSMESFIRDSNRHFVHFFVSEEILFTHIDEFETLKHQTIVLSSGPGQRFKDNGFHVINTSLPEAEVVGQLFQLRQAGHYEQRISEQDNVPIRRVREELSAREKEVLRLMIKGLINKEIADSLDISLTTVIFHRNNICEKLKTRSIGKMTIYAVLSGIIDINEI